MTVKEYLLQIADCEAQIRAYTRQIEELKSLMYSVRGLSYDKDRVQTSARDDQMLGLIAKADALTEKWYAEIDHLMQLKGRIMYEITLVDRPNYRRLLTYKYVDCMRWSQVAAAMHIENMRSLFFMHGRALKAFGEIHNKMADVH